MTKQEGKAEFAIYANQLIEKHGDKAIIEATNEADARLERGDLDGHRTWTAIVRAIRAKRIEDEVIRHTLERARESQDDAEDILGLFCDAVENGDVPDQRILEYLARCFRLILGHGERDAHTGRVRILGPMPAAKALNLERRKGRGRPSKDEGRLIEANAKDERNLELARAVARLLKRPMSANMAYKAVADREKVGKSTVRRAYEEFGETVKDQT